MPSTLVNETNVYKKSSESNATPANHSERSVPARSASTLPLAAHQHLSPAYTRQSRTLPAGTDYLTAPIPKRPSNASFKAMLAQETSQPWNDLKTVMSSASLLAQALEPSSHIISVPANAQYAGSPHASMFSYPTSPETTTEDSMDRVPKPTQRFYQTAVSKQPPGQSANVLHTVRQGLEYVPTSLTQILFTLINKQFQ